MILKESHVEEAALTWFGELGYTVAHGPHMAPGELSSERESFADVILVGRLRDSITRLNPTIPEVARKDALRKVLRLDNPAYLANNCAFHHMLRDGVEVEYKRPDSSIAGDRVRLVDLADAQASDWLAVNPFTVIEGQHNRRPDIVVFVNGLPLAVLEREFDRDPRFSGSSSPNLRSSPREIRNFSGRAHATVKHYLQVHSDRRLA